jgi:hypothetical protein
MRAVESGGSRDESQRALRVPLATRRTGGKRRCVDPTTCEHDYSGEELAFMKAIDQYKRDFRRPFPSWSEILEVAHALGYRLVAEPTRVHPSRAGRLELDGLSLTRAEWARRLGITLAALQGRLSHGWALRDALTRKAES